MIAIKTVLAVSAVASASAFSALTTFPEAEARASFSERFPMSSQMLVPPTKAADDRTGQQVSADRKGDKVAALDSLCAGQQWPYIAPECLVAGKGSTVRQPTRIVTVDRPAIVAQR